MTEPQPVVAALALAVAVAAGCATRPMPAVPPTARAPGFDELRTRDLDAIFNAPVLARATMAVRVESLASGAVLYGPFGHLGEHPDARKVGHRHDLRGGIDRGSD